jgi:BirA family transcriptional regulator, biotin operon repressor / biotin---[acetyl-CoA-carboxylase] ligase
VANLKSVFEVTRAWAEQRNLAVAAFDEIGSTNDEAKQEAFELETAPKLYVAAHQTQGRGRGKNTWLDTGSGDNLLSSWSFHLAQPPQAITGPRVGEALHRAASSVWPALEWSVKAPNDLYLNEHKVAGLLVETISQGSFHRIVLGLGMNVLNHPRTIANATHFAETALAGEGGVGEDEWYQFLDVLLGQFRLAMLDVQLPTLTREVRTALLKALNAFPGKKEEFLDVEPSGDLVLKSGKMLWP